MNTNLYWSLPTAAMEKTRLGKNLSFNFPTLIKILVFLLPPTNAASQNEINFLSSQSNCNGQKIKVKDFLPTQAVVGKNYALDLMIFFRYLAASSWFLLT